MKQSRLVRLLHLLTLYRRSAATLLRTSRHLLRINRRAGAQMFSEYLSIKSDITCTQKTVASMLSAIIPEDAA